MPPQIRAENNFLGTQRAEACPNTSAHVTVEKEKSVLDSVTGDGIRYTYSLFSFHFAGSVIKKIKNKKKIVSEETNFLPLVGVRVSNAIAMAARTVKVSNVSLGATEQDIKEFFSFSGDIEYVEMQSGDEWSQVAYVTFKDLQGAETAMLLSGATIVDLSVIIAPAPDYKLPPSASAPPEYKDAKPAARPESTIQKAEDVVTSMLAKGFILGKDAVTKAKTFDEKHQLTSTATAKVASLDKKIGLSEKITMGTSAVNEKVKEMDQKFQVSEKTKSAFAAAEQKVSSTRSAIMKNRYVFTSASWVTGAFNKVAKAASDVGTKTKEKIVAGEAQHKGLEGELDQVRLSDESSKAGSGDHSSSKKPAPAEGLIL